MASESKSGERYHFASKAKDVRQSNIIAAKAIADAVRTSLGPRGMDKMIQAGAGSVVISNDGATILKHMEVHHPAAKMLVELSKSQDIVAGDGTTSVVVLAGSLLNACTVLLARGIHPAVITRAFQMAQRKAEEILESIAVPVDLTDRDQLIKAATTSLASKVVSQYSRLLAPIAVDAVLGVTSPEDTTVDLNSVRVVKQLGGTIDDTELVDGIVFNQKASHTSGAPTRIEGAKVGLIQFCLSAPKTDIENSVVISEFSAMDRVLRQERKYILRMCKAIKKTGCNVLLIQKSILRDATTELSLHYLAKYGIMVVPNIDRKEVEFICRTLGCRPAASIDSFDADKLGTAGLVEEVNLSGNRVVKVTDVPNPGRTMSVLVRGSNALVLDEAERSLHDALCVMRSLVKKRFLIGGGGMPEIEVSQRLAEWAKTLASTEQFCVRSFADALEVIPFTLAENAGLHPVAIVTELRNRHAKGETTAGINVRRGCISDILEEEVLQPLLVNTSELSLATECVRMIMKIDDVTLVR
eukprot:PLAT5661.1.p2 GENE.PLAT5661.1~~PLAT5661.1.p2  ORF type:complete len:527 (+),score=303.75 PLAT5661.1:60-1640(+)